MRATEWTTTSVGERWGELARFMKVASEWTHGELELVDLYDMMLSGRYHTIVIDDCGEILAVCCLRLTNKGRKRVLLCENMSGTRMNDWLPVMFDFSHELKRKLGAERLELIGRPGWARALRRHFPGCIQEKDVTLIIEEK